MRNIGECKFYLSFFECDANISELPHIQIIPFAMENIHSPNCGQGGWLNSHNWDPKRITESEVAVEPLFCVCRKTAHYK